MNRVGNNFMSDWFVRSAYDEWINSPTLFDHFYDRQRFYYFVSACVYYVTRILFVERKMAWKELKTQYLDERLNIDLREIKHVDNSHITNFKHEILSKFEFLIEYEKNRIPRASFSYAEYADKQQFVGGNA